MNLISEWYTMRSVFGMLFVALASNTCTLVMAGNWDQSSEAKGRQADPLDHPVFLSVAQGENGNLVPPDDRLQRYTLPSITMSLDDGLDGYFRPTFDEGLDGYFRTVGNHGRDECCQPFCDNPCPCVYGQVEALFLMRHPQFNRQPIVVDPNTNTTFLSTSDLDYNYDPGLRATFGARICGNRALEFTYFGLFDGNASATVVQPNPNVFLTFPNNLAGNVFVDMERVRVNYSSWLNSFEANLPCCCGCCDETGCGECGECGENCGSGFGNCQSFEWFGGFRYINLGEELNIYAERTVAGAVESGSYNIRTANHLYGAQLGARTRRTRGRFGWEAGGKAGIYGNDAQQEQTVIDFPNFPLRNTSTSSSAVAFVGETNLTGLYRLTNVWNLRAGYNVMWIGGLALAPDQLDFNFAAAQGGNQLNNSGGMLLHGFNVGVEARY